MSPARLAALALPLALLGCSAMVTGSYAAPDGAVDATSDASNDLPDDAPDDAPDGDDAPDDVPADEAAVDTGPPEDCATPFDDDGDGLANEGCPCDPGASRACFPRPMSQLAEGCRMGIQACGADGTWAACLDAWLPDAMGRCLVTERFSDTMVSRRPVDVVWFVDTSGSMAAETSAVNANLNRFAQRMAESGLDYRVVMIATRGQGTRQVCVPAPLGGPLCTDGPRFRHVPQAIASTDGLRQVIATYPQWSSFLREGTVRVLVAVTDDDSSLGADAFDTMLRGLGGWDGYVFNSIVGYETRADCPSMTRRGSVYLTLTDRTMGQRARVCDSDWSGIFVTFARTIASRVTSWVLSDTPRLDTLEVWLTVPGSPERRLLTGWTYDRATRRLTLEPDVIPVMGSSVRVVYRVASLSP